jgi:hypothetical protein
MQGMRGFAETQARRLLRVLLLWLGQMSAGPATEILLRWKNIGHFGTIYRMLLSLSFRMTKMLPLPVII